MTVGQGVRRVSGALLQSAQCLIHSVLDDDWEGQIKWSTRLSEAAEAALRKAEEVLLVEWQVPL